MKKRTLNELPDSALRGRRVLVRVDYNVPLDGGAVVDDTRIRATLPTLTYLSDHGARTILMSHLGRPKGSWKPEYSLRPVSVRLEQLLPGRTVRFVSDVIGPAAHGAIDGLGAGELLLLENVRFLAGEETNDSKLSESLAAFADVYVNDAFGAAHRAHASTCGVAEAVRAEGKPAVAGFLMATELQYLDRALEEPDRPFVAILGGAKITGKIDVIEALLPRVDRLLIGGAMANTFFRALGLETGKSLVEEDRIRMAADLLERAGAKLFLPVDVVVAEQAQADAPALTVPRDEVSPELRILDIGAKTVSVFGDMIAEARTILWNGPMGMFEVAPFAEGTRAIARLVAAATERGATTIAGGGDTVAALEAAGLADRLSHVLTGGGASLEYLEGKPLPGIALLDDRPGAPS